MTQRYVLAALVAASLGCEADSGADPGVDRGMADMTRDGTSMADATPLPDAAAMPDATPMPDATLISDAAPMPDAALISDATPMVDAEPECQAGDTRPCPAPDACPGSTQTCMDGVFGPCDAPIEICNGLDDDCDAIADEDLPVDRWFPDPDEDGFYGPVVAQIQPSCAAWYASGARESGVYRIDPGEGLPLDVVCEMRADGGGWTRVFFHDVSDGYWADLDALNHNADDPAALRYSILGRLEAFRSSDGGFEFRIDWPDTDVPGRNIWRQQSNPAVDPIAGYAALDVDYEDNGWGGLERNRFSGAAYIDGTVGHPNWFYAIASAGPWNNPAGIPSNNAPVPRVALWVRPDDAVEQVEPEPIETCGPRPGVSQVGGDCAPNVAAARPGGQEICDGLDNDCNGQVDDGFEYRTWYPDRDEDGRGASAGNSCASLFADGVAADGIQTIHPAGIDGPRLDVYCDMTTDGGGWTRVFSHAVGGGFFGSNAHAALAAVDDPEADLYSILTHIEHFRSSTGAFELRIDWPDLDGRNIWRQTSNPTTAPVMGYQAIEVDHVDQFWGGLELSDRPNTYLDGSVGHPNWFYAIGAQTPWRPNADADPGIPSFGPVAAGVALWVRPDDDRVGGTQIFDCAAPEGYVAVAGDCDDTDPAIGPGADERCNGVDDDCDDAVDEGCPAGGVQLDQAPGALQFYARDPQTNRCAAPIAGRLDGAARQVRIRALRDDAVVAEADAAAADFALDLPLESGLHRYRISVEWSDAAGRDWRPAHVFDDVICGDVFVIDGQSNAVATDYHNERLGNLERSPFVRSFGISARDATVANDTDFHLAIAHGAYQRGSIGQWGLRLANRIKDAEQIPILVINGAVGGTRVDQHQRDDANPENLSTIYGRLLWRVRRAGVAGRVRAIFWHQGESDGPLPYDTYLQRWTAMYEDWLVDYPNVDDIFVFQVRAGCGNPTWNRNVARDLPTLLERVTASMSTTGIDGHDNCHFFHRTYVEWAERLARLVRRDLYGAEVAGNIDAPSPEHARWRTPTELVIEYGATGGGLAVQPGAAAYFTLQDGVQVVGARVEETALVLTTADPSAATWVSLVDVPGDIAWIVNDLGIGSFAYYELPIEP